MIYDRLFFIICDILFFVCVSIGTNKCHNREKIIITAIGNFGL